MEQEIILETDKRDNKKRVILICFAVLVMATVFLHLTGLITSDGDFRILYLTVGKVSLLLITLIFVMLLGGKLNMTAILAFALALASSVCAWINGEYFDTTVISYQIFVVADLFFVLSAFGNHARYLSGFSILFDAIKACLFYPFVSFGSLFKTLFQRKNPLGKDAKRNILYAVIGVAAALILGSIVASILSYDPKFKQLFRFDIQWDEFPLFIVRLLLTVPVAALLFGAFTSSSERKYPKLSTPEKIEAMRTRIKRVPVVIFAIPTVTLLVIYGLFFFSQWEVYMSAFSGVLPSSFTYAEYARSGFFELCVVAFINAAFSAAFHLFVKEATTASSIIRKIGNTLLALATLILIATAISKMALYIKSYDLTLLRLYTSIFMILIAIGFVLSLVAQWIPRVKVFPAVFVVAAALLLVVPFINVRGRIAAYNVDAYLSRAEQNIVDNRIDYRYMTIDLGSAGIPEAIRLLESGRLDDKDAAALLTILNERYDELHERETARRSLADTRALRALEAFFDRNH